MGLLGGFFKSNNKSKRAATPRYGRRQNVKIRCASCGSDKLHKDNKDIISCQSCGKDYSLGEARKTLGTVYCRDCINHSINLYSDGILERCNIWGLDNCYSVCDRKETKPPKRWTDANRWERD